MGPFEIVLNVRKLNAGYGYDVNARDPHPAASCEHATHPHVHARRLCAGEGFLAAGHVCTVDGFEAYHEFTSRFHVPVAVTGFEPVDRLAGILDCVRLIERHETVVVNTYQRSVREAGNLHARRLVSDVYETCDRHWRGLGVIPSGGLKLRADWREFDATERFIRSDSPLMTSSRCRSGEVLTGRIRPTECECFGRECTPSSPMGAPMVSSEGACAAYYQHSLRVDGELEAAR